MGFKGRNIFNPFAKTDREVRKMADNITKGIILGGFAGASALKKVVDRLRKAEIAQKASQSIEMHQLNSFLEECKKNNDYQIIYKVHIRLLNTITAYYTSPTSSDLFYELKNILRNKIDNLKTESIKKECEISIEILDLLEKQKDAESIISYIKTKQQNPNDAKWVDSIQKSKIITEISKSDERQLLNEYVNKYIAEVNVKYMIIYTTSARLMMALNEYYKSPSSLSLFDALQKILENKIASVKSDKIKKECSASIQAIELLRNCNNVDEVIKQMIQMYPTSDI